MSNGHLMPPVGGDDHSTGPADAPVTLVEYGDFECSYCGMAYPIVKQLQDAMGDRMRFVFRSFPLGEIHPHAEHAAEAAEAAADVDRFWDMHDLLYEHQDRLGDQALVRYAEELGMDGGEVRSDLEEGTFADRVRRQFMSGVRSGVNGTPTFFINGERFDGAWNDPGAFLRALREAAGAAGAGSRS
jgi:protein-disulfide isomerase